ncbi:MAG: hypothetical protein ACFFCO_10395 [Promethearchaeota archaeon]
MSQFRAIETLGVLGGIGAVLSPLVVMVLPFRFPYLFILSPIRWFLILPVFMICITGAVVSIHASTLASKAPDTAGFRFLIVGFLALICGVLSFFNVLLMVSAILLIIAGGICDTIWSRVKRARRITGFPWRGVATSLGGRWHSKLSCRFCGAPLVILAAIGRQQVVLAKTLCPLDKVPELVTLPLAWMDGWIDVFRDRLHRCIKCGERTESLRTSRQGRHYTLLRVFCSRHRVHARRKIWSPLYDHVARLPEFDVGFRSDHVAPRVRPVVRECRPRGVSQGQVVTPEYPPIRRRSPSYRGSSQRYCSECGVLVDVGDRYCFRCGYALH